MRVGGEEYPSFDAKYDRARCPMRYKTTPVTQISTSFTLHFCLLQHSL